MKIFPLGVASAILGWPLYATYNAWTFSRIEQGRVSKAKTFLSFVPVLLVSTIIWSAFWVGVIWMLVTIVKRLAS